MRNFVCIRARKCHCWGDGSKPARRVGVGGLTKHDLRLIDTPNADEKRLEQNMICSEETSWQPVPLTRSLAKRIGADREDFFSAKARRRMEDLGIAEPSRPEAVRTINFLAVVSPEWLRNGDAANPLDTVKADQFAKAAADFFREIYAENFLGCVIHADELNTHCSAYVLPAVRKIRRRAGRPRKDDKPSDSAVPAKTWGLSAKSMLTPDQRLTTGDEKTVRIYDSGTCSKLQSEFAQFCKSRGLNVTRGVHGSRARHRDIAEQNHLLRSAGMPKERIARIDDIEKLRKIALQNVLKAREQDELQSKLRLSIESERQAREGEYHAQQKLLAVEREKQELKRDLFRVLRVKKDELLRQILKQLRAKFQIAADIISPKNSREDLGL